MHVQLAVKIPLLRSVDSFPGFTCFCDAGSKKIYKNNSNKKIKHTELSVQSIVRFDRDRKLHSYMYVCKP